MKVFFHETWPQPLRISGQVCKWDSGSGNRCLIDSLLGMIDATKIDMFWGNGQDILLVNVESYDPSKKPDGICITVHDEAYALRETCVPAVFALLESWEDGSDRERA